MVRDRLTKTRALIERLSPLQFFLGVAVFFGLLLVALVPPFQGSDEPLHFYRAYQISEFNFVVDRNVGNDSGGVLPIALSDTVAITTNQSSLGNLKPDEKYRLKASKKALSMHIDGKKKQWTNFTATALYPPIAYLPQATGIGIGRIFNTSPLILMYLGRIFNVASWILLIAISIRLMPRKKWAMVFIGLLPVALTQSASLSADAMTIGLFAVFLSAIFYWRASEAPINKKSAVLFVVGAGGMVLCKQIMFVFLPLVLLIPQARFTSPKVAAGFKAAFMMAPLLLYGIWQTIIHDVDMKSVFSKHQDPTAQVAFVLHHPLHFLEVLWNTHFFTYGDTITRSFMGTFGWGDVGISELFVTVGYIGLFLVVIAYPYRLERAWVSNRQKLLLLAVGITYAVAVSAALYAYYNPVGAPVIAGIQGRYLLPLAFLAVPLCWGRWLKMTHTAYRRIAMIIPLVLLIASVISIYFRYYVTIS